MTCFPPRVPRLLVAALLAIACDRGTTEPATRVHPAGAVSSRLTLPDSPTSISVSPSGVAFVTLLDRNEIARFNTAAPTTLMPAVPIPVHAQDIAFTHSGTVALVAAADLDRWVVYSMDVRSGDLTFARPMDNAPARVALSPAEDRFFVVMYGDPAQIYSYPLKNINQAQSAVTQIPGVSHAIAVSPTTGALFVTTNFRVARLDPASLEIQAIAGPIPVASEDVVLSADGSRVWYGSPSGTLVALDATSLEKVAEIATGDTIRGLALSPDGTQLWATSLGDVLVIDPVQGSIVTRLTVGGSAGRIAFDRAGATAFVANDQGWVDVIR
jgi:DNA-binding beta-propeller fold protein YncE